MLGLTVFSIGSKIKVRGSLVRHNIEGNKKGILIVFESVVVIELDVSLI